MFTSIEEDPLGVEAVSVGFYEIYRNVGDRFLVRNGKLFFSHRWMRRLSGEEFAELLGVSRGNISFSFIWSQLLSDAEVLAIVGLAEEKVVC